MCTAMLPPESIHHIIEEAVHSICHASEEMIKIKVGERLGVDRLGFCFSQNHFV